MFSMNWMVVHLKLTKGMQLIRSKGRRLNRLHKKIHDWRYEIEVMIFLSQTHFCLSNLTKDRNTKRFIYSSKGGLDHAGLMSQCLGKYSFPQQFCCLVQITPLLRHPQDGHAAVKCHGNRGTVSSKKQFGEKNTRIFTDLQLATICSPNL